jgi:hypothetical protein
MNRLPFFIAFVALLLCLPGASGAQQQESYDYWSFDRKIVQRGVQAVLMCN